MRHVLFLIWMLPAIVMAEPLRVFVSVLPLQTFVEKVGGEHVEVRAMVGPGYSPHTYEPGPQQIAALARAALYVRTGVPFEDAWMERIRSANPGMLILDARADIQTRGRDAHEDHPVHTGHHDRREDHPVRAGHHDHHESDPHVWTSPPLVKRMVSAIRDKLAALDPANRTDYARNCDAFIIEIDGLDRDIRALLDPLSNRRFMVFHPAWGYFADAYDLVQVPIEREGKEPGGRTLAALIEQAKRDQVRVVFVQPQFDKRQARQIAQAIGGGVVAVDPLAPDYVENMRRVARKFAEAMGP